MPSKHDPFYFSFYQESPDMLKLQACELANIQEEFAKKGIKLYINGDTPYGQRIIADNLAQRRLIVAKLSNLHDGNGLRATTCITQFWNQEKFSMAGDPLEYVWKRDEIAEVEAQIKFLREEKSGAFKTEFTAEEQLQAKAVFYRDDNAVSKKFYHQLFMRALRFTDHHMECSLTKRQAAEEVQHIQRGLASQEIAAYIYTNQVRSRGSHFEVLIIGDAICKPIEWRGPPDQVVLKRDDIPQMFSPIIGDCITSGTRDGKDIPRDRQHTVAQLDFYSCATFGLYYLEKLLENNAYRFHHSSLRFSYYEKFGGLRRRFIPAPEVLAISQSDIHNLAYVAIFADSLEPVSVSVDKDTYQVTTLKALLSQSKQIAEEQGDQQTAEQTEQLLQALPELSKRWLAEFQKVQAAREHLTPGAHYHSHVHSLRYHQIGGLADMDEGRRTTVVKEPSCESKPAISDLFRAQSTGSHTTNQSALPSAHLVQQFSSGRYSAEELQDQAVESLSSPSDDSPGPSDSKNLCVIL